MMWCTSLSPSSSSHCFCRHNNEYIKNSCSLRLELLMDVGLNLLHAPEMRECASQTPAVKKNNISWLGVVSISFSLFIFSMQIMTFLSLLSSQCKTIESRRWIPSVHLTPSQEYIFLMVSHPHDDARFVHIHRQLSPDATSQHHSMPSFTWCPRCFSIVVLCYFFSRFAFCRRVCVCFAFKRLNWKMSPLVVLLFAVMSRIKVIYTSPMFSTFCFIFFFVLFVCLELSSRDYRFVSFSCVRNKWAHFSSTFSLELHRLVDGFTPQHDKCECFVRWMVWHPQGSRLSPFLWDTPCDCERNYAKEMEGWWHEDFTIDHFSLRNIFIAACHVLSIVSAFWCQFILIFLTMRHKT